MGSVVAQKKSLGTVNKNFLGKEFPGSLVIRTVFPLQGGTSLIPGLEELRSPKPGGTVKKFKRKQKA